MQPSCLCHPLLLLPSVFPSIKVFYNELALHIRWPKYCSFSFSISPSNEYSGLISFRIDQFDLLTVQGALKSLLQHHSSKASILWCSAFFMVQPSHPYMSAEKKLRVSSVQFGSVAQLCPFRLFATPWTAAQQASLSITNSWSLLKRGLPNFNSEIGIWPNTRQ